MNECLNGLLIKTENTIKEKTEYKNSLKKQIAESENTINDLLQKKSDIDEKAKKNEELKERKNNLSNELVKKQSLIENKRMEQKSLNSSLIEKKQNYSNQIESEKRILESIDSEKESKIKLINDKSEMYSAQIKTLEDEIDDLKNQSFNKNKDVEDISIKINSFSINSIDEDEINVLSNEIKSYESIVSKNKIISEYNENVEEIKKNDKKKLEKLKIKKQKFEQEKFDLENSKKILTTDYPSWAILQNLKNIENDINEFIDQVYYKPLNIKFDMTRSGISMRFGDDIKVERLSGAEKAITNIGFCESFNKNLNLNMILLDEPDAPLSATRKEMFYSSLLEMKDVFEQMIVVTHSKDMVAYLQANATDCNIITL